MAAEVDPLQSSPPQSREVPGAGELSKPPKRSIFQKLRKPGKKPDTPDSHAVEIKTLYQQALSTMRNELMNYWLNYAFLDGAQWVWWNVENNKINELPRDPDRVRITVNRMASNTRTIMAHAMQRHLTFEVLPNAADDAHVRGAKLGETIIRNIHRAHDWEVIRERHYQALWKGGTAAIAVEWDPDAKDIIIPMSDEGDPAVHEGDTIETVLSIAEFVVEPGTRDPERARYWIKAMVLPPKEVQARYELDWEPASDGVTAQAPYAARFNMGGIPGDLKLTLVLTYYERPNFLNEQGEVTVVVNDQIVHSAAWPFPVKDRLNLFVARETVVENKWTGTTVLTFARSIQTALNASWSTIIEHMKRAGNARLFVPQSMLDMVETLTDQASEIVPYPDGTSNPPSWGSPPQMPTWWIQEPVNLQMQLDDIMGVHDVSRGEAPSNIQSGYGVSVLVEQDTTPVGRMVKETARIWSDVASFVLKLYEQEVHTKRKLTVAVPGQAPAAIVWDGTDLKGQTTAVVPPDAIIPRSRAAQMQIAQQFVQMGLIQNIADFAFVSEMPDSRSMLAAISPDIERARRENAIFSAGRTAVAADFDDHEIHIHEHNRWRKSVDYELLDDQQKQAILEHIQAHSTLAAQELGRQRAGSQIDPELGMQPGATGAPPVAPLPPQQPEQGAAPGGAQGQQGLVPDQQALMNARHRVLAQRILEAMTNKPGK